MVSRGAAWLHHPFLLLCLRVPKSGSQSLQTALNAACPLRGFYLPNTLDLDGQLSRFQRMRFRRSQARNLLRHYGSASLKRAFQLIDRNAAPGTLLSGGHIDFRSVFGQLKREVKIITILRNPYDRCRSDYYYGRRNHLRKSPLRRIDSSMSQRAAAKFDFESYLDFLLDHRHIYGDIAANYFGLPPWCDIDKFFSRHVFHAGALEDSRHFAVSLSNKLGIPVIFPHLNDSGSAQHVTLRGNTKRRIETLYARDFEIYEYVVAQNRSRRTSIIRSRAAAGPRFGGQV